jgi:hypothetical protein
MELFACISVSRTDSRLHDNRTRPPDPVSVIVRGRSGDVLIEKKYGGPVTEDYVSASVNNCTTIYWNVNSVDCYTVNLGLPRMRILYRVRVKMKATS